MFSGHGNVETAVSAIQRGAYDFIEKPFKADRLLLVAERALETARLRRENKDLKQTSVSADARLIGQSAAISQLRTIIDRVAKTNSRVMITGASGSGKELVARTIHGQSTRANAPFVVLNAATITPAGMEEALFGTEIGVNGAPRKVGALEEAHGGTLYLDEIADMPEETQSKILRVLVDQVFQRVGGTTWVKVDVRIISSSANDIQDAVETGRLRQDLYHRLNVVPIRVPSLAERRQDIPDLVSHFVEQVCRANGLVRRAFADDAMAILQSQDWPGNIRQLRNNIERMLILTSGSADSLITADMLPAEMSDSLPPLPGGSGSERIMGLPLRDAREVFEREYLTTQISRFGGNISRTAEFVGMERSALHRKLKALGVG
jgi:two-component system nitrogen regulation response regulator NtrX